MIKNFFITILLTLFFSNSYAEIIKKIIVDGNERVSEETIRVYGEIEINKDYKEKDLNKILNNLYSTDFFEDINISINQKTLNIIVKEYPVVNQLILKGEPKKGYKVEIKKLIKTKEKGSFIKANLSKDIEIIKKLYSSLGYNFAEVEVKSKKIDNSNIDLLIELNRGKKTKIATISFLGNNKIRSKRLGDIIASEEAKFWKFISRNTNLSENIVNLDKRLLLNYYKSIGFYDVKVNSNIAKINQDGKANLIYTIDEGNRYTINKISTNIDQVFDKKLFFPLNKVFKKYAGDYYSPFKIKKLLEEIDVLVENNNLQFVEHNVKEIIEKDSINIIFNIFEGEKKLVERINIIGNNTTNEEVIRGELIIDEGDPLTKLNLEKSIAEIKARGIFKEVTSEISDGSEENLKIININVEEMSTGEITAGAGVGSSGGTLAFGIRENNWLGEGKSLALDVQLNQESLGGFITYEDPNYNFLGNSIFYKVASEKNDKPNQGYENSVVSASIGTGFEQYRNVKVSLGLNAAYDDLKTLSSASAALKKQSGTFTEFSGNYGFAFDQRDRAFMPTSGSFISFSQTLPIYADKNFIANTFNSNFYKSINENVLGSSRFFITAINGLGDDDVRLNKRRSLSSKKLRGFERGKVGPVDGSDHIGGNYAAALNLEASLPNLLPDNTNADASMFLDFGNVWGVDYSNTLDDSNEAFSFNLGTTF